MTIMIAIVAGFIVTGGPLLLMVKHQNERQSRERLDWRIKRYVKCHH